MPNQSRAVEPEQWQNAGAGIDQVHLVLKQVSSGSLHMVPGEMVCVCYLLLQVAVQQQPWWLQGGSRTVKHLGFNVF